MRRLIRSIFGGIALSCTFSGCTTFNETYYVGIYDPPANKGQVGQPAQFYRFRCHGSTVFSNTRFETGTYNADAVDRLFGAVVDEARVGPADPNRANTSHVAVVPSVSGAGDAANANPKVSDARVDLVFNGKVPDVTGVTDVDAATVYLFDTGTDDNKPTQITEIQVRGSLVLSAGATGFAPGNCDLVTARTQGGEISCGTLTSVELFNGPVSVVSTDAKSQNGDWTGGNHKASVDSKYVSCSWSGSTYALRNGVVKSSLARLDATNAYMKSDTVQTFSATRGVTITVAAKPPASPGKPVSTFATVSASDLRLVAGKPLRIYAGNALKPAEISFARGKIDAAVANYTIDKGTAKHVFVLSNVKFSVMSGGAPQLLNPVSPDSAQTPLSFPKSFATASLTIKTGDLRINSSDAVTTAMRAGKTVVTHGAAVDDAANGKLRFGPEGTQPAQIRNQRFVVVMHSDPRAITQRIRALTNSDVTQAVVAQALTAPRQLDQLKATQAVNDEIAYDKKLAADFKTALDGDDANLDSAKLAERVKQFLGALETK